MIVAFTLAEGEDALAAFCGNVARDAIAADSAALELEHAFPEVGGPVCRGKGSASGTASVDEEQSKVRSGTACCGSEERAVGDGHIQRRRAAPDRARVFTCRAHGPDAHLAAPERFYAYLRLAEYRKQHGRSGDGGAVLRCSRTERDSFLAPYTGADGEAPDRTAAVDSARAGGAGVFDAPVVGAVLQVQPAPVLGAEELARCCIVGDVIARCRERPRPRRNGCAEGAVAREHHTHELRSGSKLHSTHTMGEGEEVLRHVAKLARFGDLPMQG